MFITTTDCRITILYKVKICTPLYYSRGMNSILRIYIKCLE